MIGSYFDLDRAIAQIASKRETKARNIETRETQSERIRAYSDFDRSLNDFVRAVDDNGGEGASSNIADLGASDPNGGRKAPSRHATLSNQASTRRAGGSLGQIR